MSIELSGVRKSFGDFVAVDDVSLEVRDGSLTALLGPSGSGKSTLLRIIAGLEVPDSGRVVIAGADRTDTPARSRDVGFVFQHYAPFKHMTVRDNIAFGLKIRKVPRERIRERVRELLELVHLEGYAGHYPSQLSGGQRQRMALARATLGLPITHVGGSMVRPHDVDIATTPVAGGTEALVERILHLGFEVRVELVTGDGLPVHAQLTRQECEELELREGQIVYIRPNRLLRAVA